MCPCECHVLALSSPPNLTSMCLHCRQCPCLSARWTYFHLCVCLGLMSNTCRIVSRLFKWTFKGVTYKGHPMLQWMINIFFICIQPVHKPTLPRFSEGQLLSELFSHCQFMTGLISVLWWEGGRSCSQGFCRKLLKAYKQQRCKSSSLIRTRQHFLTKSTAKYGTKGFSLLLSGVGESFILPTGPTSHEIWLSCFECDGQKDRQITLQVLFWRGIPFASVVYGMFLRLTCIPWVCETFSSACQVTAPPLDLKNW